MLPRIHRLKEKKDFRNLFRLGVRFKAGPFTLVCVSNQLEVSRIGVVVRKGFGPAVMRNRAKRVARHLGMEFQDTISPPSDIVILPQKGFLEENRERLKSRFEKALAELGFRSDRE